MNCKSAAKYLYAHADGELGMSESLEVLEHLSMCPECCQKVNAQLQLKASLVRVENGLQPPALFEHRLRRQIRLQEAPPGLLSGFFRSRRPLVTAAGIAIILTLGWYFWPIGGSRSNQAYPTSVLGHCEVSDGGPMAVALADRLYQAHLLCAEQGSHRHDPALPHDGTMAATIMSQTNLNVVGCEQVARLQAHFESAGLCHLTDTLGGVHPCAHIVYRIKNGQPISLMSISHLPEMNHLHKKRIDQRDYVIIQPASVQNDRATIVAWDCPQSTHVLCTPMSLVETTQLVQQIRQPAAMNPPTSQPSSDLARQ